VALHPLGGVEYKTMFAPRYACRWCSTKVSGGQRTGLNQAMLPQTQCLASPTGTGRKNVMVEETRLACKKNTVVS